MVVIGSKTSSYFEIKILLEREKIKHLVILKGGIDVIYLDKPDLIQK